MGKKDLIICPVYNEEETLEEFYGRLRDYYAGDILFIDDGSTDGGREFLEKVRGEKTFLIRHHGRKGYGAALSLGFKFSLEKRYEQIVTLDVDLQHDPEKIPEFLNELLDAELVLGSRYIRIDKSLDVPRDRLLINRYIAKLISRLFLVAFTDPFCGYRGYRDTFLKRIHLREKAYGLALEILLEAVRVKAKFCEIPIEIIYLDPARKFLDGLDCPETRLQYYLDIIFRKRTEIENEKKVFDHQPSS